MGRARFMVYPWFFLTARPWAERGSWFTCFFFVDLSATRPKLPLGQILSHATCDVYSPKAVENINKSHLRYWLLREKIKNPVLVKNYIFSGEISLGTYTYLYSLESSMKWPFPDIFSFGVNKNLRLQNHAKPTRCKKISYYLSVNSYHTLAGGKSIP